jgi:hypothetical protein
MIEKLCEPHHLLIIIGLLFLLLLLIFLGLPIRKLIGAALKKLLGKNEVNINLQGGEMKNSASPDNCPAHQAEHERSIRNQENIGKLFDKIDNLKTCIEEGSRTVSREIGDMKIAIIKALTLRG